MNLFCLLAKTSNGPNYHVIIAGAALRQLDRDPAQKVWARWRLFTYSWNISKRKKL